MGGRGSSYVTATEQRERARDFMEAMRSAGFTVRKTLEEGREILKDDKYMNKVRKVQNTYVNTRELANYQSGFYKTSNADNQKGYMAEKTYLMKKAGYNRTKVAEITESAQNKHKAKLEEISVKMTNAKNNADYKRYKKQYDTTWGKLQAANFINWSRR